MKLQQLLPAHPLQLAPRIFVGSITHKQVVRKSFRMSAHESLIKRGDGVASGPAPKRLRHSGAGINITACASSTTASATGSNNSLRVRYVRKAKDYQGWGLHVWGDVAQATDWARPLQPISLDKHGISFEVSLRPGAQRVELIMHRGDSKGATATLEVPSLQQGAVVWLVGEELGAHISSDEASPPDLSAVPAGSLNSQAAIWVDSDTIVWRHAVRDEEGDRRFCLHYSRDAGMSITGAGVQGAVEVFPLEVLPPASASPGAPAAAATPAAGSGPAAAGTQHQAAPWSERFPYLAGCSALRVPDEVRKQALRLSKGQLLLSMSSASGTALDATGLQLQGLLDAECFYPGRLGAFVREEDGRVAIAVWAPTAQQVELLHFPGPQGGEPRVLPMHEGGSGVWRVQAPEGEDWMWTYYKYRVTVYCPWTHNIEVSETSDPYSRSLAADGDRTQIVPPDLNHPDLMPEGWTGHAIPGIKQWTDISVYELHVRDFSAADESVPSDMRGKYLAFCPDRVRSASGQLSAGLTHLSALRAAGLNHLHLLPCYDFGSVPERKEDQHEIKVDLSQFPPHSEQQQREVLQVADRDAFNWGYDPVHWGVPEGSYATHPDGPARVREFREMVQALHGQGWRVVLDVVYNHIFAAGPHNRHSVLDKIVPGYYVRRMEDGAVCHSTCCNNTATEHAMAERLVVDDIAHWARNYKVDGFRFDIMGHLMLSTLTKMRAALDELTPERDGVDGRSVYIYGEAWDFGEVVGNARGKNCGQMNLSGSRLGAFNDRLRDGALGGGPFAPHDFQGLVTGLALAPNGTAKQGGFNAQLSELLTLTDWVRYSLAGNLRSYRMETADGRVLRGEEARIHGQAVAYGGEPCEHIAFIGCHDNLTMFDSITEKAPLTATAEERMRMAVMCLALITLSQGVPFIHGGDDLLRSKSLDRDSYNSGDWFNRIDWTGNSHNLGIGLPVATKNEHAWGYRRPLLANPLIKPTPQHIRTATAIFQMLLRVRYSSPLFRMPHTEHVINQLRFLNTGPNQVPGVVVMQLTSSSSPQAAGTHDLNFKSLLVVFNCTPLKQELPYPGSTPHLELHPLMAPAAAPPDLRLAACAADDAARVLRVAPRTAAVFVQPW